MSLLQPKFPDISTALGKPKFPVHEKLKHPLRKRNLFFYVSFTNTKIRY